MFQALFFVEWFKKYGRHFPWRYEGITPYKSLVTEMLLRQTRAGEVAKLWNNFFDKYPMVESLAHAGRPQLVKQIVILGFGNQRAEALKQASQYLVQHHRGEIPHSLDELLQIEGLGAGGDVLSRHRGSANHEQVNARQHVFGEIFEHDVYDIARPAASLKYRWVNEGEWKLIIPHAERVPEGQIELYHVAEDPDELKNLAMSEPDRVTKLRQVLDDWWRPE